MNDEGLVWRRKKDKNRYMMARNGDMWMFPFQCDRCWFLNLKGREPDSRSGLDVKLLSYIRRVNLDMFWSRAKGTVEGTCRMVEKEIRLSEEIDLIPNLARRGPWPLGDNVGFQLAIIMLKASQEPGKHSDSYQQFDSIRKLRSSHHHVEDSGVEAVNGSVHFQTEKGKVYSLTSSETESLLFRRFIEGLEDRMGRDVRQQKGMSVQLLKQILEQYEQELERGEVSEARKRMITMCGAHFALLFGGSLRGNEGLMVEAQGLCKHVSVGVNHVTPHVLVPLLGRFKNELGERLILLALVDESKSGIKFRWWIERLVEVLVKESKDKNSGPAFCNEDGTMLSSKVINEELHQQIHLANATDHSLVPQGIDVEERFGTYRSFRIGSNTRALHQNVPTRIIELIHRWSTVERNRGSKPSFKMMDHYLDMENMLETYLSYSRAL